MIQTQLIWISLNHFLLVSPSVIPKLQFRCSVEIATDSASSNRSCNWQTPPWPPASKDGCVNAECISTLFKALTKAYYWKRNRQSTRQLPSSRRENFYNYHLMPTEVIKLIKLVKMGHWSALESSGYNSQIILRRSNRPSCAKVGVVNVQNISVHFFYLRNILTIVIDSWLLMATEEWQKIISLFSSNFFPTWVLFEFRSFK